MAHKHNLDWRVYNTEGELVARCYSTWDAVVLASDYTGGKVKHGRITVYTHEGRPVFKRDEKQGFEVGLICKKIQESVYGPPSSRLPRTMPRPGLESM
jgi:hypothetical protein